MPREARTPKTLANWLELDYFRRPRPLRHLARWPAWILLLLSIGALGWLTLPPHRRIYQAGELSRGHAALSNQCEACHRDSGHVWRRLWPGNAELRSVSRDTCLECHPVARHAAGLEEAHCASCHREHQGRILLAQTVSDAVCATCHANLPALRPETQLTGSASAFPSAHPPFRGQRFTDLTGAAAASPYTVAFNHHKHLTLDPQAFREPRQVEAFARLQKQQCLACHELDGAGRDMLPVQFARHCAACHHQSNLGVRIEGERNFQGALEQAAEAFRQEPAPHQEPAVVRAVLRQRFLDFAKAHPEVAGQQLGPPPRLQLTPGRPPIAATAEKPEAWADWQTRTALSALFSQAKTGCAFCHQETGRTRDDLPIYAPTRRAGESASALQLPAPQRPNRWLPRATFSHARHRRMGSKSEPESCLECHHNVNSSSATGAAHLPALADCAACHRPGGGARHDCIECHRYHHSEQGPYVTPQRSAPQAALSRIAQRSALLEERP